MLHIKSSIKNLENQGKMSLQFLADGKLAAQSSLHFELSGSNPSEVTRFQPDQEKIIVKGLQFYVDEIRQALSSVFAGSFESIYLGSPNFQNSELGVNGVNYKKPSKKEKKIPKAPLENPKIETLISVHGIDDISAAMEFGQHIKPAELVNIEIRIPKINDLISKQLLSVVLQNGKMVFSNNL